ncbi:hypothetical protein BRD00_06430 [Halobacteriales archaeon QS_8_69_26]|nr:MAG: hypothetical protein BRD00_06430 [Halobacteriales archaeon QS_8_69_26]
MVRVASVHRQVGYRHLTTPDSQGVHAPRNRGFVVLGIEPAGDREGGDDLPPPHAFELVAGDRRFFAGTDARPPYRIGTPAGNRRYEPDRRPNGWVAVPLPVPFDADTAAPVVLSSVRLSISCVSVTTRVHVRSEDDERCGTF